jgi:two-component system chemotaxis sensor kinase CheA
MNATDPAQTYRQEAAELLEQLEQALLDLDRTPGDADLIDTAFRALHTIKGSGAMFGFERMAAFAHHVESAFDLVRQGKVRADPRLIAVTLAAKDQIRCLIETPELAGHAAGEAILEELRQVVAAAAAGPPEADDVIAAEPASGRWRLRFRLPADAIALGTNPLLLLDELRDLGPCTVVADTATVPPLEELDPTACYLGWEVVLTTPQRRAAIDEIFLFVLDGMELNVEDLSAGPAPAPASAPAPAPAPPSDTAPIAEPAPAAEEPPARADPAASRDGGSIRVPADRLDALMDRVGELVIAQSRLKQLAADSGDNGVKSAAEEIERLVLDLRDTTMGVRLVPISQLFGRFRRVVHDLARDLGKEVAFVTHGEDTELDKTLIERLSDPLIHLIRNALDHGMETPAQRLAAGKPAQGSITLSACHRGHEVMVSVTDDGRGLDRARIRQHAIARGLLAQAAQPDDAELFRMLFKPGFSTSQEVTSVSGRGVGLDVVQRAIDMLRGGIDIATEPGRATSFTLRLPLTLAIIDGLLVRVGRGRYVIPLAAVEECVELPPADAAEAHGHSFLNIRGALVPFVRLREFFAVPGTAEPYQKVIIVAAGEQRIGLVVDQVIGDHQTVVKSLSKLHAGIGMFCGATILGDGAVALILEVAQLLALGQPGDARPQVAA